MYKSFTKATDCSIITTLYHVWHNRPAFQQMESIQVTLACPQKSSLRTSLNFLMISAIPGSFAAVCLTPFVITSLLRESGASLFLQSLVPGIVQGAGFIGIPIAILLGTLSPKKAFLLPFAFSRLTFLFMLLPLLIGWHEPVLILATYLLSKLMAGGSMGAMHTWLRGLVPDKIQPIYFGRRTAIGMVLMAIGTLAIGQTIDAGWSFTHVLIIGLAMGLIDLCLLNQVKNAGPQQRFDIKTSIKICLSTWLERQTWTLLVISLIAYLGFCLFLPFQIPYYYDHQLSTFVIAALTTVQGLAAGFGAWLGGLTCKGWNPLRATGLGSGLVGISALGHLLLPVTPFGMLLPALFIGAATGCLLVSFNQLMYQEIGEGGNIQYASLLAMLLAGQLVMMALSSGLGTLLETTGYALPILSGATLFSILGAIILWLYSSIKHCDQ